MKKFMFFLIVVISFNSNAACLYNGNPYPTGTVIGGLTCQADGSWR